MPRAFNARNVAQLLQLQKPLRLTYPLVRVSVGVGDPVTDSDPCTAAAAPGLRAAAPADAAAAGRGAPDADREPVAAAPSGGALGPARGREGAGEAEPSAAPAAEPQVEGGHDDEEASHLVGSSH